MSESNTTLQVTAKKYLKGAIDGTFRNRLMLKELQRRSNILYNQNGYDLTYDVQFREPPIQATSDGGSLSFSAHDLYRQYTHDYRGYVGTDLLTNKTYFMNRGDAAIVRYYDKKIPNLLKAMTNVFNEELYIDGYAAGNEERVCGFESFFGNDGNTVAADLVANPSDTYHGLSTALASEGGTWSTDLGAGNYPNATIATDWPEGQGPSHYDYNSPIIVNRTSSNWGTNSTDWEDNAPRILRRTKNWLTHRGGMEASPDCFMLALDLMTGVQNSADPALRIMVPHKGAQDLGFEDVLNYNGVQVKAEYDVTPGEGYAVNYDQMELRCLTSDLFTAIGPDEDPRSDEWLFKVRTWLNARHFPKYFGKIAAIA